MVGKGDTSLTPMCRVGPGLDRQELALRFRDCGLGVELHRRIVSHIHPDVNVW